MLALLCTPVVLSVAVAALGSRVLRRVDPAITVVLVPALAVAIAADLVLSLGCAAILLAARLPLVAGLLGLSRAVLPWSCHGVPAAVAVVPGAVGVALTTATARRLVTTGAHLREARDLYSALPRTRDGVRVTDDPLPRAFAVGGRRGFVVVSTGMLDRLDARELRAVLAHEYAHLRRHHHAAVLAVQLAAAADPALRPLRAVLTDAIERDADERAARVVGSRRDVALAICRAATAPTAPARGRVTLAAAAGNTRQRVELLLAPPPRMRWSGTAALLTVVVLTAGASVTGYSTGMTTDHALDRSHTVWQHGARRAAAQG